MKKTLLLSLALVASSHAATVATIAVLGAAPDNSSSTFANYSNGGGAGANGTRIGISSTNSGNRVVAGTSVSSLWTISGAGTITVSYYLDNSTNSTFRPGIQGLYDASGGIATDAAGVNAALTAFTGLSGVSSVTVPDPYPVSLNSGAGSTGAPAELFTTTYTIAEGSAAIGLDVAVGFYSSWNAVGGYLFGSEAGANDVVIDFVPEPSSAALLGGLGLLTLLRRRR